MRCVRRSCEVLAALGADVLIGFEVGLEDGLATADALDPESFGADPLLGRAVFYLVVLPLEPGHLAIIPQSEFDTLRN